MRIAAIATATAGVLTALSAQGAERPTFPPTHDVAVTYRITGGEAVGAPHAATVAFSATRQMARGDGDPATMIIDLRQRSMVIMMSKQRMAMRMPLGRGLDQVLAMGDAGGATRIGADRVAGYACTVWRFSGKGASGTGCITDDGVPLRGQGGDAGKAVSFEAISVSYGHQPDALFEVPPGVKMLDIAGLAGHGGGAARPQP